jgi:hypothetical protein
LKTHYRLELQKPSAASIFGSATPMIEVSRVTRNCATLSTASARLVCPMQVVDDQHCRLQKCEVRGEPVETIRLQRGGFSSERDAAEALERALEHLRQQSGVGSALTFR